MPRKLSERDVLNVFHWRSQGAAVRDIAAHLHVARSHVYGILHGLARADVAPEDPVRKKYAKQVKKGFVRQSKWVANSAETTEAVRAYSSGASIRTAAAGRMSPATLYRELVRLGIRRRDGQKALRAINATRRSDAGNQDQKA